MKKQLISLILLFPWLSMANLPLNQLNLPSGFEIQVFADKLPGARTLAMSDAGVIFVGTRGEGKVYALLPGKHGEPMRKITLLDDLNEPNGVAYYKGDLYVAEINRVSKYPNVDKTLHAMPKPIVVNDKLPNERWHGYRVIDIGPDEKIYLAMGLPCNTCDYRSKQPLLGTISRMDLDGTNLEPYAIGIRNSVGFDWHPQTKELWFTDNGQDLLGDDFPPDEINRAYKPGLDFGFPYMLADNEIAPGYNENTIKGKTFEPPVYKLPAHVAPLGLIFYTGQQFPSHYHNQIFVAEHGSWNRSKKVGYQITQLTLAGNRVVKAQPFIHGWLQGQAAWGRPVDFLMMKDGSLLITDDYNGLIYQVKYKAS